MWTFNRKLTTLSFKYIGVSEIDQIFTVLLKTSMAVGCIVALILDNTIPGTIEERGLKAWRQHLSDEIDEQFQTASIKIYDLPFGLSRLSNYKMAKYLPFLAFTSRTAPQLPIWNWTPLCNRLRENRSAVLFCKLFFSLV